MSLSSGTHSLRYVYTAVSGISDTPELTVVGLVDEGQFMYFDSNTMKAVPKTDWMRENEGADYWDSQTQTDIGKHQSFKNNIQVAKERFNQSAGKMITNLLTHVVLVLTILHTNDNSVRSTATIYIPFTVYFISIKDVFVK